MDQSADNKRKRATFYVVEDEKLKPILTDLMMKGLTNREILVELRPPDPVDPDEVASDADCESTPDPPVPKDKRPPEDQKT